MWGVYAIYYRGSEGSSIAVAIRSFDPTIRRRGILPRWSPRVCTTFFVNHRILLTPVDQVSE